MMDYDLLLDMAVELGYQLAMCGAETYRVEESITRVLESYDVSAEAFVIPNCMTVSIRTPEGISITRMRRIGQHGNHMEGVEQLSNLSRKICSDKPDPKVATDWIHEENSKRKNHSLPLYLLGGFLGACGYAIFFGGSLADSICSGICGILSALVTFYLQKLRVNLFFNTIAASFIMAFSAYVMGLIGFVDNTGPVIIGALMSLVPGWLITNAIRDIIFGDTNSGMNRIVQVFLIAAALVLGTGAAWKTLSSILTVPIMPEAASHSDLISCLAAFVGCFGFLFIYNNHGYGGILCALGGALSWAVWALVHRFSQDELLAYFCAAVFGALYSEVMARIRKYPAFSYQVISLFPLIPGAAIYYATSHLVLGDLPAFWERLKQAISIAGVLAVGILLVSTTFRFLSDYKRKK